MKVSIALISLSMFVIVSSKPHIPRIFRPFGGGGFGASGSGLCSKEAYRTCESDILCF